MGKIGILLLGIFSSTGIFAESYSASNTLNTKKQTLSENLKLMNSFKKDIRSGSTFKPVPYSSLSLIEKEVINKALLIYIPHIVSCAGADYVQYKNSSKVYEARDYGTKILFDTASLSKAERLNGLSWRGSIHVTVSGGAYREIKIDNNYGQWIDRSDFRLNQEIPSLNSYSDFYIGNSVMKDGKLYYYDIGSGGVHQIGNQITVGGKDFKPLTCTQIRNGQRNIPEEPKVKEEILVDSHGVSWLRPPRLNVTAADLENEPRSVMVLIEADGQGIVTDVSVTESSGLPALDEKVIRAAKLAKFKPYVENGEYYPIRVTLPFDFSP